MATVKPTEIQVGTLFIKGAVLTAMARPPLTHHSLRLRQVIACASIDVELKKQGLGPTELPDTSPLLQDLQKMQALASPQPPDLLLADLHQLRQVGMHRLQDIMSSTGRSKITKPLGRYK